MFVFDIKRYSINDGPGIRIAIFVKGCPLNCIWCHNPEGISPKQEKFFTGTRCISCGRCVSVCPKGAITPTPANGSAQIAAGSSKCTLCGLCVKSCPTRAMEFAAQEMSIEEVMAEIEKERVFFEMSGGGVTICGGEPLLYYKELVELLKVCGERGIHRVVDTTLFASEEVVKEVAAHTDLFLVDLKQMDSDEHKKFTGVPNEVILANIRLLAKLEASFIIRVPVIEGVNALRGGLEAMADFIASLFLGSSTCSAVEYPLVELLTYHDIARGKHDRLGTLYNPTSVPMSTPSAEKLAEAVEIFTGRGISCRVG